MKLHISRKVRQHWIVDPKNVFLSRYKHDSSKRIFKFCYQPETEEFIFSVPWTHHNIMILNYGKRKFDDYVRGICFWDKETIYLRMHVNEVWLNLTKNMIRKQGIPQNIRIIWGKEAARGLAEELQGL